MSDICETCGYDWVERDVWERDRDALTQENARLKGELDACEQHVKILSENEGTAGRELERLRGLLNEWCEIATWGFEKKGAVIRPSLPKDLVQRTQKWAEEEDERTGKR